MNEFYSGLLFPFVRTPLIVRERVCVRVFMLLSARLESLCDGWIPNSNTKSFAASAECCSRDEMKLLLHQIFLSCDTF